MVSPVQIQGAPVLNVANPRPPHPPPHSFMVLAIATLIVSAVLNITSLCLGIPALYVSSLVSPVLYIYMIPSHMIYSCISCSSLHHFYQSEYAIRKNQWKKADRFGSLSNWIYVFSLAVMGAVFGLIYIPIYYKCFHSRGFQ